MLTLNEKILVDYCFEAYDVENELRKKLNKINKHLSKMNKDCEQVPQIGRIKEALDMLNGISDVIADIEQEYTDEED